MITVRAIHLNLRRGEYKGSPVDYIQLTIEDATFQVFVLTLLSRWKSYNLNLYQEQENTTKPKHNVPASAQKNVTQALSRYYATQKVVVYS